MTDKIVFIGCFSIAILGLLAESAYWHGRYDAAVAAAKQSAKDASSADGRTAACLSGTLRLIWKDGSVTRSVPAQHYERMLLPDEMKKLGGV